MWLTFNKKNIEISDEKLLAEYQETLDTEVLGRLYERYMHLVYGVCLKYLGEREQAKDAVMQIYMKLTDEVPKRDIQNFKSWLYVIAKNFCLMQLRSAKNNNHTIIDEELQDHIMENAYIVHPTDDDHEEEHNLDALRSCIEKLKDDQKRCVQLFYLKEKSYKEIDEETKLGLSKVKSFIQNGKRNLKICIEAFHAKIEQT